MTTKQKALQWLLSRVVWDNTFLGVLGIVNGTLVGNKLMWDALSEDSKEDVAYHEWMHSWCNSIVTPE